MKKLLIITSYFLFLLNANLSFSKEQNSGLDSGQLIAQSDVAANVELLKRELDAEKKINARLNKKIQQLEGQLAVSDGHKNVAEVNLDNRASPSKIDNDETLNSSAIEQALIEKGVVLLPTKTFRLTPGFSWSHYGTSSTREDSYNYNISLDMGLPWGMMGSVKVPYGHRDFFDGSNSGMGDISFALSKQIADETMNLPAFIAQIGYQLDNGKDAFGNVPIGSGFNKISTTLSTVKHLSPIAVYGNVSFAHSFDKYVDSYQEDVSPGNSYGFGTGISLAATPNISLNAGFNISFIDKIKYQASGELPYYSPRQTVGYMTFGSGFNLNQHLFLDVSAAAGVTKGASDFVLSIALPYRF